MNQKPINLYIKNVRIVDADKDINGDILIVNGKISKIIEQKSNTIEYDNTSFFNEGNRDYLEINGKGKVLMPAFIDLHAHFREPGFTHKEDILSGSKAAVKGGYTTVVLMANVFPVCSTIDTVEYVKNRSIEVGLVDIEQVISISKDMKGENINHLADIANSVKFISDDGKGVTNNKIMTDALALSAVKGFTVISHAEDPSFSENDMRLAENFMTLRDIYASEITGGALHMAHVSTKEAMEMIIEAKKKGSNITCEVTPHHIFATNSIHYRVNPPLREKKDVDFLINAIKNDYVDVIATDHAPHTYQDKKNGSPGISGIETSFQLCLTKLVKQEGLSLKKLSKLMSKKPAEIMNINKGMIIEGYIGDLVLIDINKKTNIDVKKFVSKGKNSPFNGFEVYGEILLTIKNGEIVYRNEDIVL